MGYKALLKPQRAGQGGTYATLNPNAVSPVFVKGLINCTLENDCWETERGTRQMNAVALAGTPTIGTCVQFFPVPGVSRLIACGRDGTVWVSSDEGLTFTLLTSALVPGRLIVPVTGGSETTGLPKKLVLFGGGKPLVLAGDPGVDAGLADPTVAPSLTIVVASGAVPLGEHQYVYTFGNLLGETGPSPAASIVVANGAQARVSAVVPSGPPGTTFRRLYRTKVTGDTTTMFRVTTQYDNDPWTYEDNVSDGQLGTKVAPVQNATATIHGIARPPADWAKGNQPTAGFLLEGRLCGFGNNNQTHGLYVSLRDDHEDFLSTGAQFIPVFTGKGDAITAGVYWRAQGWVFKSPRGIYRIDTSNIDPIQWQVHEHTDAVGCVGPLALVLIQGSDESQFYDDVVFVAPDASWHRLSKTAAYQAGDVNASSISEKTFGQFIHENVDPARLPFCQLIYFDQIEEIWGGFTQIGSTVNGLRIKANIKRLPEFGVRFHHSTYPECEGLGLMINPDLTRSPIAGGSGGILKACYQRVYGEPGVPYVGEWTTWDDNFQDLGEGYKIAMKNYHFLVVEGVSVGDWTMTVEVTIDGVLQPTTLSIPMLGKSSVFVLDESQLDVQALSERRPLFVSRRLRGRGHRISYRGFLSTVNGQYFQIQQIQTAFSLSGYSFGNKK